MTSAVIMHKKLLFFLFLVIVTISFILVYYYYPSQNPYKKNISEKIYLKNVVEINDLLIKNFSILERKIVYDSIKLKEGYFILFKHKIKFYVSGYYLCLKNITIKFKKWPLQLGEAIALGFITDKPMVRSGNYIMVTAFIWIGNLKFAEIKPKYKKITIDLKTPELRSRGTGLKDKYAIALRIIPTIPIENLVEYIDLRYAYLEYSKG